MDVGLLDRWISATVLPPVIADDADGAIDLDRWISASIAAPLMFPAGGAEESSSSSSSSSTSVSISSASSSTFWQAARWVTGATQVWVFGPEAAQV